MILVVRSNYGDESIALIECIRENLANPTNHFKTIKKVYAVYIDTGWAAQGWNDRVLQAEQFVQRAGFEPIRLQAKTTFSELVLERKSFPTKKFQWCAGFLKGLPLMTWLDELDPGCEWVIALPKRQALYRQPIEEFKSECEYHGERKIWHPMIAASHETRDRWLQQAGFTPLNHRSLECDPCINSRADEVARLAAPDRAKMYALAQQIGKPMILVNPAAPHPKPTQSMDNFSMGCGDPFGCGL